MNAVRTPYGDDTGDMYGQVTPLRASQAQVLEEPREDETVMPLPAWLIKVYFLFPIVLYVPDVIFNYYVYSDGLQFGDLNPLIQASQVALWLFLAVGVVGMQWLLSVLAPWHWGRGHRIQAFFCGVGVLVATAITFWNSLSFRSTIFHQFPTDAWVYSVWPELAVQKISLTMILIAFAPPFWGLFWAVVQPTRSRRGLGDMHRSHQEELLKVSHQAELKRMRAEANAKVREAQLKGMAQTAAAARQQAGTLFSRRKDDDKDDDKDDGWTPPAAAIPAHLVSLPSDQLPTPPSHRAGSLQAQGDTRELAPSTTPAVSAKPSRTKAPAKASATRVATPSTPRAETIASTSAIGGGDELTRGPLDHVTAPGDELRVLDPVYRAPRA